MHSRKRRVVQQIIAKADHRIHAHIFVKVGLAQIEVDQQHGLLEIEGDAHAPD